MRTSALAVCVSLLACSERTPAPIPAAGGSTPVRGGELHLASAFDIKSLDPAVVSDVLTSEIVELVFAGLVDFDESGHVVPDLAERFERSEDGMTYRFFLREGLKFHDGSPLTAEECRRSIERSLSPDTPSSFAAYYDRIDGFDDYNTNKTAPHLRGVVVEGERVLAIHLREPDAAFLSIFAMQGLRPVCPSAGDKYEDTWTPCGAGPYMLESWDRGRNVRLKRFDGWWEPGRPYFDSLTYQFGMNLVTQRFKFDQGDIDIDRELTLPDTFKYQNDPRWKPLGGYDVIPSIGGEAMNVEMPPFDNVEVRRAVAAAIDREQFRMIKSSALLALERILVPSLGGDDPSIGQKYDYAAALEHMRRAGYPYDPKTGQGGWPKTIVYPIYKQGLFELSSQVIQQQLAKIGLRIELKTVSYPTYLMMTKRRGTTAMAPSAWSQDFPDASDFFDSLFASNQINDEDSNNGSFYSNPHLDDLLVRGRRELDPKTRKQIYDEADRIICDDAPWAVEYQYRFYGVHQPYVKQLRWSTVWSNYVRDVWIDKPKKVAARRPDALRWMLGLLK